MIPKNDEKEKFLLFRQFCFTILKEIRIIGSDIDSQFIINKFEATFGVKLKVITNKSIDITKSLDKLKII